MPEGAISLTGLMLADAGDESGLALALIDTLRRLELIEAKLDHIGHHLGLIPDEEFRKHYPKQES